jgi:hypothetical protein
MTPFARALLQVVIAEGNLRIQTDVSSLATGISKVSAIENVVYPDLGITMQVCFFENPIKGSIQYVTRLM